MRGWLKDSDQTEWTLVAWVRREEGPYDTVGIIGNGGCTSEACYLLTASLDGNNDSVVVAGIAADNGFPATETGEYVSLFWNITFCFLLHELK